MSNLTNNTNELQEILEILQDKVTGVTLPALSNEGTAADLLEGKEFIDSFGNIITGAIETFDGSYTCSGESTGGNGASVEAWTGHITSEHIGAEFEIHYTDVMLTHCTTTVVGLEQDATITIAAGTLIYGSGVDESRGSGFVHPIENDYTLILPNADNFEIEIE